MDTFLKWSPFQVILKTGVHGTDDILLMINIGLDDIYIVKLGYS